MQEDTPNSTARQRQREVNKRYGIDAASEIEGELVLNDLGKQLKHWDVEGALFLNQEGHEFKDIHSSGVTTKWIQIGSKCGRPVGVCSGDVPHSGITLQQLQENFERNMTLWRQSSCRQTLLSMLRRVQPDEGWLIQKTVCLGTASPSTLCFPANDRRSQQLACAIDMSAELGNSDGKYIDIYAQDPAYFQIDKDFLASIGVNVLESAHPQDCETGGVGEAKQHLGPHTLVLEFRIPPWREVIKDLYQSDCKICVGWSEKHYADYRVKDFWPSVERQHWSRRFPEFEEDPHPFDALTIHFHDTPSPDSDVETNMQDNVEAGADSKEEHLVLNALGKTVKDYDLEHAYESKLLSEGELPCDEDVKEMKHFESGKAWRKPTSIEIGRRGAYSVKVSSMHILDKDITLAQLHEKFDTKLQMWRQSSCRKKTLAILKSIRPEAGWQINKTVCLATGGFSTLFFGGNNRSMEQFVYVMDLANEMGKEIAAGAAGMEIYAQDPAYHQIDKDFISSKGVNVLECSRPDYKGENGIGKTRQHLGSHTMLFEFFLPKYRRTVQDIYQSNSRLYFGRSIADLRDWNDDSDRMRELIDPFLEDHWTRLLPYFGESPQVLPVQVYWKNARESDEDGSGTDMAMPAT